MNCVINAISRGKNISNTDIYIMNSIVSLASCKGSVDKILITNIKSIKKEYLEQIERFNIKVVFCEFNEFDFDEKIPWGLAYYKICALNFAVNNLDYDSYLLVDTDTVFIRNLNEAFWNECGEISLYYLPYSKDFKDRKDFLYECKTLMGINDDLKYYGGEFVCGTQNGLRKYLLECKKIWEDMRFRNIYSVRGDEFIWSIAAARCNNISFANPFIDRVAISQHYYSATTNYAHDDCKILHLIGEKNTGLVWAYHYLLKKGKLPNLDRMRKVFGLKKAKRGYAFLTRFHIRSYFNKILEKGTKIWKRN